MRRKSFTRAEKKAYEISNKLFSVDFKVTPSMRRKVDDLALWLAAGDKSKVRGATQAVIYQFAGLLYAEYGQRAFLGMTVISAVGLAAALLLMRLWKGELLVAGRS